MEDKKPQEKEFVKLVVKNLPEGDDYKALKEPKEFEKSHAIKLLSLPNSQWESKDEKFKWNGKDFVVNDEKEVKK